MNGYSQLRIGGNGLREGGNFERRHPDYQAMPLHINAHRDRVTEQIGRHLLGLATENPFWPDPAVPENPLGRPRACGPPPGRPRHPRLRRRQMTPARRNASTSVGP